MDREVLRLLANADQMRSAQQEALAQMSDDDLIELFRDCMAGRLPTDERSRLLVGSLAGLMIMTIRNADFGGGGA
jgi:hypothetical protein